MGRGVLENPKFGKAVWESLSPSCLGEETRVFQEWLCLSVPAGLCHWLGAARDQRGAKAVLDFRAQWVGPLVSYTP